ncbi:MAG: hypothetical protein ACRD68_16885, partial [Pyrinomonadaceae bacterium]
MRYSYRLQPIALLLACVVAAPAPLSGQEPAEPARQTRPRRVLAPPPEVPAAAPFQPETHSHVDVSSLGITAEPFIRVGLTKDARSVTISTDGQLLHAADTDPAPVPLEAARVRVEPRSYPPITPAVEGAAKVQAAKADKSGVARIDSARDVTGETARDVNAGQMRRDGKLRLVARVSAPTRGAAVYAPT